jgi:hypothetical protein
MNTSYRQRTHNDVQITYYHGYPMKRECLQIEEGPSWSWLYGSWIYNYLYNQCLLPLMFESRWWLSVLESLSVISVKLGSPLLLWSRSTSYCIWPDWKSPGINWNEKDYTKRELLWIWFICNLYYITIQVQWSSNGEPSLTEMTEKAIKILKKNSKGFFLMVEGLLIYSIFVYSHNKQVFSFGYISRS